MTAWLDDLVDLGCNGLLLGPVFASETHGYDTVDHLRIDPRLGDDTDVDALVDACRHRGIRVLLDGVFNHVGRAHPWWQEAVEAGAGSPAAARFATGPGARTVDGLEVQVFEGHENLVVLNHDHPEVAAMVTDVMAHWLERGRRRLAPRCGVRGAGGVLAHHDRADPRAVPRRLVRGRGDPRRLRAVRRRSPAWTPSPSTSCGRRSATRSRSATGSSWRGRCSGTTSSPGRSCR